MIVKSLMDIFQGQFYLQLSVYLQYIPISSSLLIIAQICAKLIASIIYQSIYPYLYQVKQQGISCISWQKIKELIVYKEDQKDYISQKQSNLFSTILQGQSQYFIKLRFLKQHKRRNDFVVIIITFIFPSIISGKVEKLALRELNFHILQKRLLLKTLSMLSQQIPLQGNRINPIILNIILSLFFLLEILLYIKRVRLQSQQQNMFKGIFDTIMGTISNMNPLKHFIKYALDKTLNEFLKKQLTLEDFKNGPLNLQNIEINTQKINQSHLVSSPYIMHSGIIGNLKITLPPLSELSTQSIEISVSGVQIVLKPNKKFSENFKKKMVELHEMQKYYVEEKQMQGQISQTGPVDFFKQLLKKIILNIKVNVNNIAIKLYMNTPSQTKQSTQFYLMLRIPLIYVDKKQGKQTKTNQQINFNILLPQITVHLLNQDNIKVSEYKNQKCSSTDFPFKYPNVNHPKTILLIGSSVIPQNIITNIQNWKKDGTLNNMNFSQLGFKLHIDYKKKCKDYSFHLQVMNIESMVNPSQIKVLSRFVRQLMEFKIVLDSVLNQLKSQVSESINLNRLRSNEDLRSSSNDLFSSIMMSLSHDMGTGKQNVRQSNDMFKSMIRQDKQMRQSVREFNTQFSNKMKKMQGTQTMQVQFQVIQFKQNMKLHIQLKSLSLYILKYSPNLQFLRVWKSQSKNQQLINKYIGCDYFMLEIKKIDVVVKISQKITAVNLKSFAIYNVKLKQQKMVSADSFYEIGSSVDFQAANNNRTNAHGMQIFEYQINKDSHYCVQQIVSVSHSQSQCKKQQQNLKKYSLIPQLSRQNEDQYILYKPGVAIHINNKQKCLKINVQIISVSTNLQLILDFLNIAYPLLAYKRMADIINFKRNQSPLLANTNPQDRLKQKKVNIFQSAYEFRQEVPSLQDLKSQNKNTMILDVVEVKLGFRKGQVSWKNQKEGVVSNFADLIHKQKQKMFEEEAFNKVCFCNVEQQGIYLQLRGFNFKKKLSAIKLSCKVIDIGIMKIKDSKITSLSSILQIKTLRPDDSIRFLKQTTYCQTLLVYVPELNARFSEDQIVSVASLAVDSIKIAGNLIKYKQYLQRQMLFLQQKSSQMPKKAKKSETTQQKQIKVYVDRIHLQLDYCNFLIQQIYLSMNSQSEQVFCCKVQKLIGGIKREKPIKLKACQFKNDLMQLNIYPQFDKSDKQKFISNGDIFIEIGDRQKHPIIFRIDERTAFIQKLQKHTFTFSLKLAKKQMQAEITKMKQKSTTKSNFKISSGSLSQKFKFKQVNQTIEEEGQNKILNVEIIKEIKINVCNLLELKKYVEKVEKFVKYIKGKLQEAEEKLKSQTLLVMERKHSTQIENQMIELFVKIGQPILVDIRPDFIRNQNQKIFSNTRSIIMLTLHNSQSLIIHKDKNQKQLSLQLSLNYYFLASNDRDLDINPLSLSPDKHLSQLGFKHIMQISKISTKININNYNKMLLIKIKSILGQASISTLYLIELHLQHFVKHHIKCQYGMSIVEIYDGEDFCVLEGGDEDGDGDGEEDQVIIVGRDQFQDDQELEIQDLTGALQVYNQKLKHKKQEQQKLRHRPYTFEPSKHPLLTLQSFTLQKLTFRISENNEFNFIKLNSLNQSSPTTKRTRNKQPQQMDYYIFYINNLMVKADMSNYEGMENGQEIDVIGAFVKVEKIEVSRGWHKNYGHFGLKSLEYFSSEGSFIILRNQSQVCVVFEKNPHKVLIKLYTLKLFVGGTTLIIKTLKKVKQIGQQIQRSGWRKIYQPKPTTPPLSLKQSKLIKKDTRKENQRLVILIPQSTLKVTFQYSNILKIMDEQTIILKQLILNQEIRQTYQIKQRIRKWVKSVAKNNIAGLISGTALNLLVKLVSQLVTLNVWWVSKILGPFFGGNQ